MNRIEASQLCSNPTSPVDSSWYGKIESKRCLALHRQNAQDEKHTRRVNQDLYDEKKRGNIRAD